MTKYIKIIFGICLIVNVIFSFVGIDHTLLEYHGFRQTQTAISTYYTIEDGCKVDYETPVLGSPWSLPFEFPLYQWTVAGVYKTFGFSSLEAAGRAVSYLMFLISLLVIYSILKIVLNKNENRLPVLSIILVMPTYLYWSRTFMIESTALMFSLIYLRSTFGLTKSRKWILFFVGLTSGVLAGLVKSTTLIVFSFAVLFVIYKYLKLLNTPKLKNNILNCIYLVIPILATVFWTMYADNVRDKNLLIDVGSFIWTMGTINQKLIVIAGFLLFAVLLHFFCRKLKYYRQIQLLSGLFWIAPIIFSNLYLQHDYYYYVNMLFAAGAIGYFLFSLFESKSLKLSKFAYYVLYPVLLVVLFSGYLTIYFPKQNTNNTTLENICKIIKENTDKNDVLLIYGQDWNSSVPFYSERRAIMDKDGLELKHKVFDNINKEGRKIGVMLIRDDYAKINGFAEARIKEFGLSDCPVYKDSVFGYLYIRKK